MSEEFEDIIHTIKRFELVNGKWKNFECEQNDDQLHLLEICKFIQDNNKIYYFVFSKTMGLHDILGETERALRNTKDKPQDTYVIFFYKTDDINEATYREVIAIEENEFLFKKYVFYYTEKELQDYHKRSGKITFDKTFWQNEYIEKFRYLASKFLLRLVIKVPIIKLNFSVKELRDCDIIFAELIQNISEKKELLELDSKINRLLITDNCDSVAEELINELSKEIEDYGDIFK